MSDPVTNTEIEDVLSSIRRLVSEEPLRARKKPAEEAGPGKLVLTPAFRVPEPSEETAGPDPATDRPHAAEPADTDAQGDHPDEGTKTAALQGAQDQPESAEQSETAARDRIPDQIDAAMADQAEPLEAAAQEQPHWTEEDDEYDLSELADKPRTGKAANDQSSVKPDDTPEILTPEASDEADRERSPEAMELGDAEHADDHDPDRAVAPAESGHAQQDTARAAGNDLPADLNAPEALSTQGAELAEGRPGLRQGDAAEGTRSEQTAAFSPELTLEQRIAELEAAISHSMDEWEPDGSEDGTSDETRPLSLGLDAIQAVPDQAITAIAPQVAPMDDAPEPSSQADEEAGIDSEDTEEDMAVPVAAADISDVVLALHGAEKHAPESAAEDPEKEAPVSDVLLDTDGDAAAEDVAAVVGESDTTPQDEALEASDAEAFEVVTEVKTETDAGAGAPDEPVTGDTERPDAGLAPVSEDIDGSPELSARDEAPMIEIPAEDDPQPEDVAREEELAMDDAHARPEDAHSAEPLGAAAASQDNADAPFDLYADEATMDEEALRDLVSELVRQELQGVLGERITRNVRRLVRREIQRALAVRDFE